MTSKVTNSAAVSTGPRTDEGNAGLIKLATSSEVRSSVAAPRWLRRLSGPILLVVVWWAVTASGQVSPTSFPKPSQVIDVAIDLARTGQLQAAMWASTSRVLLGLAIGVSSGLLVAILATASRRSEDLVDSSMQLLKAIPNFSLVPLLIIWLGIDEAPKITLIALSTSMPIYMNTFGAIRNVDERLVEAARTLGLGRLGLVRHIIVPGAVPGFLVGLRISFTSAWLALIFAEQINANEGLGKLMSEARSWYRVDLMVLVVVIYAVLGLLSYSFVRFLERRLLDWRLGYTGE